MSKLPITLLALGALSLAACKQEGTSVSNNQTQGQTDEAAVENAGLGNMADANMADVAAAGADIRYVADAAASDMFEMQSSQLALEKATLPALKTFAQLMIDEHGKSSAELKTAARAAGIPIPAALPAAQQGKLDALRGLSGSAFDRQYLADQRAGHQETLTNVNTYLAAAPAGPLKDHASKTTGVVQKHLNSLEKIK